MVGFAGAGPIRACYRGGAPTAVLTQARWSARGHLRERGPENADHASRQREEEARNRLANQERCNAKEGGNQTPYLIVQPYGRLVVTLRGLPAAISVIAWRM